MEDLVFDKFLSADSHVKLKKNIFAIYVLGLHIIS